MAATARHSVLAMLAGPALAANLVQDFEGGATAPFNWQVGTIVDGTEGWSVTPGSAAEISTAQSGSGSQSLKLSGSATGAAASHSTAFTGGGA